MKVFLLHSGKNAPDSAYFVDAFFVAIELIFSLWDPTNKKAIELLYKPMLKMRLNSYELTFLLAQILWTTQGMKSIFLKNFIPELISVEKFS